MIEGLIADLDSEKFAVRQDAFNNLLKVGEQALPVLKKTLAKQWTLETQRRMENLHDRLSSGILTDEQVRVVRTVEALERIGTAEARQFLKTLAGGAPGVLLTREARMALDRLTAPLP